MGDGPRDFTVCFDRVDDSYTARELVQVMLTMIDRASDGPPELRRARLTFYSAILKAASSYLTDRVTMDYGHG